VNRIFVFNKRTKTKRDLPGGKVRDEESMDKVQLTSDKIEIMFYKYYNMAVKGVGKT